MGKSEITEKELLNIKNKNYVHVLWQIIRCHEAKSDQLEYHIEKARELLIDSHSPTEPEFDTLQEGDCAECYSISEYKDILMKNPSVTNLESVANCCFSMKIVVYHGGFLLWIPKHKKTQLTPEEFLRRAENTFKTK